MVAVAVVVSLVTMVVAFAVAVRWPAAAGTMITIFAATVAATAMRVGGGALSGSEGGGKPGAVAAGGVDGGGEQEQGFITPCPPLSCPWK